MPPGREGERAVRYAFYIHKRLRAWRLVLLEGAPAPAGCLIEDWSHSRTREHADTTADVREQVAARGFALFKLGGDFADVARELAAHAVALAPVGESRARPLEAYPVHLGLGATALQEPELSGELAWYADYAARHAADGNEGRLVSMFSFERAWDVWEVHPHGSELVLCTAGVLTLVQEVDGEPLHIPLRVGHYAINPPGIWHTVDVDAMASAVFITSGVGTAHRPR